MTENFPSSVIAGVSFIGRRDGLVKNLQGFKKGHHTLPDAANSATTAFLGKICEPELTAEAEKLFQATREGLDFKRKDLSLHVASPAAVLTTKDFVVEILYALDAAAPAQFSVVTTLHSLKNAELVRTEEFERIFSAMFTELSFALKKGVKIEAVIDVIEALEGEGGLEVSYPSDCHECVIRVADVPAEVRCGGGSLELIFPRPGSPRELIDAFATVRGAFRVSRELAGMIR